MSQTAGDSTGQGKDLVRSLGAVAEVTDEALLLAAADSDAAGSEISYVSPAFCRLMGYRPADLIGRSPRVLEGPSTDPQEAARVDACLSRQSVYRGVMTGLTKAGEEIRIERRISAIRDDSGRATHWVSAYQQPDPPGAAQVEPEGARRDSKSVRNRGFLAEAIEALQDGFVIFISDERMVLCNQRYREIYQEIAELLIPGISLEEVARATARRCLGLTGSAAIEAWVEARMRRHRELSGPTDQRLGDGRWLRVGEYRLANGWTVGTRADISELKRREAELSESEARLRSIIEYSSAEISLKDADGRYVLTNPQYETTSGIGTEATVGKRPQDIFYQEMADQIAAHDRAVLESGKAIEREIEVNLNDGLQTFLVNKFPIKAPDGSIAGIGGIATDITGRKRAEAALRSREEQIRMITGNLPVAITHLDKDLRYLFANATAERWLGRRREEVIGRKVEDLWGSEGIDILRSHAEQARQGHGVTMESENTTPDGTRRVVRRCLIPHLDEAGRAQGFFVLALDITEQRATGDRLRLSEERHRQATELARLGYWVWDSIADKCLVCSEGHARIHGVGVEEYLARASAIDGDFPLTHPDDREASKSAVRTLRRTGTGFETEYRVVTPDGDVRHVREVVKPILDECGTVIQ